MKDEPRSMIGAAFLDHYGHYCVFILFSSFLVDFDHLVNPNVTDQITIYQNEISGDQSSSIDVSHCIARGKGFFGCEDGDNLDP